jgi:hypothetical protein
MPAHLDCDYFWMADSDQTLRQDDAQAQGRTTGKHKPGRKIPQKRPLCARIGGKGPVSRQNRKLDARLRKSELRLSNPVAAQERDQHRNPSPVAAVALAEMRDEIALLESDRDQDVGRRHDRQHEMRDGHRRCRPEREVPADVQRMADVAVRAMAQGGACPVGTAMGIADQNRSSAVPKISSASA